MNDEDFLDLEFHSTFYKENHWGNLLIRTNAVVRQARPLDSRRFVAYLGPEWMSMVGRPRADAPQYEKDVIRKLRLYATGIPLYGKARDDVGLERVMKPLWSLAKTRTPIQIGGWCVYKENKVGSIYTADPQFCCMHLSEFGLRELPPELFERDDEFLEDRDELMILLHGKSLPS